MELVQHMVVELNARRTRRRRSRRPGDTRHEGENSDDQHSPRCARRWPDASARLPDADTVRPAIVTTHIVATED
ncbi:hypothetical protein [Actinocorallia libanotica]|uniref:hypothetical protein n=1 Tax=Actinocorallia libanotica TaxID=46162 RepID=UPI0031DA0342